MMAHHSPLLCALAGACAALTAPARVVWWRLEIRSLKHWREALLRNQAMREAERCSTEIEAARVKLAMAEAGR